MEKRTVEDLKMLQALPLDVKIAKTKLRIREWYEEFDGEVYISFSGGKDSTVLLHLVRELYPNVEAVFVDTGLEYPELREFAKTFENVTIIKPSMLFNEVINIYGYPVASKEVARTIYYARKNIDNKDSLYIKKLNGELTYKGEKSQYNCDKWQFLIDAPFKISPFCCDIMKKKPFRIYEKEHQKKPFIGTMASESRLRQQKWLQNGCNAFNQKKPSSQPISFWTEQDVYQYILNNDLKIASVYGDIVKYNSELTIYGEKYKLKTTGCDRTGCMFCMFGVHLEESPNRFQRMKETHPKQYEYCLKSVDEGGLGLGEVLDFIDVEY